MTYKSGQTNEWHLALGQAVREERLRQRKTQEDLAFGSEFHCTEISRMEAGRRNNTYLSLRRIAIGLGVPLSDLIRRAEEIEREAG